MEVPPVAAVISRPLWSVMIPTYNCAEYLRETLTSVLTQDPGPEVMQIEVVDDHSTRDDPAQVVEELGRGRVSFYRQPQNVGHVRNFQTCLERSRGRLIHLLHGDDAVRPGFYYKLEQVFASNPEIGAAFCRYILMDEHSHWQAVTWLEQPESGILKDWLARIAVEQRIQTPSMVVRREVYEKLGGFDRRLSWSEDWEMWVRLAAYYSVGYEPEPLAIYRIHSNSSSGQKMQTGENMRDIRRAIDLFQAYLPEATAHELANQARENWAFEAIREVAPEMLRRGNARAAGIQIQEALKCSRSLKVMQEVAPLFLRLSFFGLRQIIQTVRLRCQSGLPRSGIVGH